MLSIIPHKLKLSNFKKIHQRRKSRNLFLVESGIFKNIALKLSPKAVWGMVDNYLTCNKHDHPHYETLYRSSEGYDINVFYTDDGAYYLGSNFTIFNYKGETLICFL